MHFIMVFRFGQFLEQELAGAGDGKTVAVAGGHAVGLLEIDAFSWFLPILDVASGSVFGVWSGLLSLD